ncbi:hypothetical protein [Bythopirellula polymerisocia]|uniref:Internalin-A n=1 Tax=Bythopirellula polymerisocia TaxID=2528003 RepID=A0A5C6CGB6_9BACT|nr:hypothetical protein [Bythopirellula polymerisocia]TWU22604.1 Internalin-A precursor [Bythopirellula polymerisocia]
MSVENPMSCEPSEGIRQRSTHVKSLLRVFVITVPLYTAGIASLEYLLAPRGITLGVGVIFIWVSATILWIIAELISKGSLRFGMRSILVATTVVAILCFLAVQYVRPYTTQRQAMEILKKTGVRYESQVRAPIWLQRLVGPQNCQVVTAVQGHQQSRLEDNLMENISGSPHLYELFIGNSLITDKGLRHIKGMNNLLALDLPSGPEVSNACMAHLAAMKQLNWIDASDVPVKDEGLAYLSKLTQIEQIELNRSQIKDAGLIHLKPLTNLRRLVLDNNDISDAGLKHIQPLTNLIMLSLEDTQITDDGLKYLQALDKLQYLRLSGTRITDAGLEILMKMKSLRVLELEDTSVTLYGLQKLRAVLNKCITTHDELPRNARIRQYQFFGYQMYRDRTAKMKDNPFEF